VSRLAQLEARRQTLLARCDAQRADLAGRLSELQPRRAALAAVAGAGAAGGALAARHPLWLAAIAALAFFGRTRDVAQLLIRARTVLSVVSRTVQLLRALRAQRAERGAGAS